LRAEVLYAQLDVLREVRPKAKAAMVAEARRDPAWPVLRSIPFLGPVRVALLLATMKTPWGREVEIVISTARCFALRTARSNRATSSALRTVGSFFDVRGNGM
jgi:hypothetical protein